MHIDQGRFFKNFLITNELLVNKDLTKSELKLIVNQLYGLKELGIELGVNYKLFKIELRGNHKLFLNELGINYKLIPN